MQFQVRDSDDSCQPPAQYTNPRVVVEEHRGAPLLNWSGLVLVRQLIERLGVASAIDAGVRVLRRCKWYRESDHILTLIYNMLSGGSKLQDINRLGQDAALKRVLGSDRIPHATTIGKFLWRFGDDQQDKQRLGLTELRETVQGVQQDAFAMLPRERRRVATLDWDSSIHEVYGQKKEGADYAYDNTWSYNVLYATVAETGDVLYLGLREGYRHTSYGTKEVLPGTIERVSKHFRKVRMRADSGYYSQALVEICEAREVEFFIVAKQHRNLMKALREIPESHWKSFADSDLQEAGRSRRRRQRRPNLKRKITKRRKPNSRFKGAPEVASMMFQPRSWKKARRYVIKRTPVIDKDDQQLYLDDGLRRYVYWIVVTNSKRSNGQVLRIAQGRGNQENLIKDFKYGLGLAHVPTGSLAANQAYFVIAALAWNLKTWMLNLLRLGDGAVMRCQRFRYQWICQAGVVAKTGRNTVVLKLPAGEYFQRFGTALARLTTL